MRIRLTSLILLVILIGSTVAGVPMPFGEQSCSMDHAMGDMSCCEASMMPSGNAETATARLCCALTCSKEGTAPSQVARFAPQLQLTVVSFPSATERSLTSHLKNRQFDSSHGPPGDSHPAYIRNLALLI